MPPESPEDCEAAVGPDRTDVLKEGLLLIFPGDRLSARDGISTVGTARLAVAGCRGFVGPCPSAPLDEQAQPYGAVSACAHGAHDARPVVSGSVSSGSSAPLGRPRRTPPAGRAPPRGRRRPRLPGRRAPPAPGTSSRPAGPGDHRRAGRGPPRRPRGRRGRRRRTAPLDPGSPPVPPAPPAPCASRARGPRGPCDPAPPRGRAAPPHPRGPPPG